MRWCVVLIALAGCAPTSTDAPVDDRAESADPAPLAFDPAFSDEEMRLLLAAQAQWDTIAKPWSGAGWRVLKQVPPVNAAGITYPGTKTILVHPTLLERRGEREFLTYTLHEFGHAHGLGHTTTGVMRGGEGLRGPDSPDFAPEDVAECVRVGAC